MSTTIRRPSSAMLLDMNFIGVQLALDAGFTGEEVRWMFDLEEKPSVNTVEIIFEGSTEVDVPSILALGVRARK